jgi:hypothetical protein
VVRSLNKERLTVEDIRDIVIRTDETVKHLRDKFDKHEVDGNRKYDMLMESAIHVLNLVI